MTEKSALAANAAFLDQLLIQVRETACAIHRLRDRVRGRGSPAWLVDQAEAYSKRAGGLVLTLMRCRQALGSVPAPAAPMQLPLPNAGAERVETGPVQFGDDWPGIFIRGDQALALACMLDGMAQAPPVGADPERLRAAAVDLAALLRSCAVGGGDE
jgi:hypothetical protein